MIIIIIILMIIKPQAILDNDNGAIYIGMNIFFLFFRINVLKPSKKHFFCQNNFVGLNLV